MGKKIDYSETESAQLTDSRDLAYLKANGARALPDSPTERGWSAAAIKRQLFMQPEILYAWLKKLAESQLALAQTIDSYLDALSKGKETPKVYPTLDDAEAAQASGALVSGSLVFVAGDDVEVYLVGSDGSLSDIGLPLKETKSRIEAAESKVSVLETRADEADSGISALEARADRAESGISSLEQASETHGEAIEAIEASSVSFNKRSLDGSVLADGLKTATEGSYSAIYARRSEQDAEGNPISATYATKKEVADSISSLEKRTFQVVDELPATGEEGVIYLMAVSSDPEDGYSQYIYENGAYIGLGTTKIDLSAYATIDLVNLKTKKFIFGPSSLKDVIIAAYEEEEFRDALGFADATDVGEDGKATYGKCVILTEELTRDAEGSVIGAEYSVVANGELYHAVLLENGGSYTVSISNPYVKKDDAVLAKALESISGVQQGIVGQYLKQTPAVLVGSDYAINLKLRESRNVYDIETAPLPAITGSDSIGNLKKANNGFTYDIISEKPVSSSAWLTIVARYANYGLSDGDYITVSLDFVCSNPDFTAQLIYNYYNTDTYVSASGSSITLKSGNRSSISIPIKTNGGAYNSFRFYLSTVYNDSYPAGTTLSFNNIQIEKGSTAHPYDEYGTYSKGSVVQYAGKNVLNLPGTSAMGETSSIAGKADVSSEIAGGASNISLTQAGGFQIANSTDVKETTAPAVKGHNLLVVLRAGEPWLNNILPEHTSSIYDWSLILLPGYASSASGNYSGNDAYFVIKQSVDVPAGENTRFYATFKANFAKTFTMEKAIVIDLTANGDGNLTVQEAYEKYSASLDTLASGASIANNKRTSPLIKNFGTDLYLTKPEGYSLIISEFSDMPPALNQSVNFDDLTFLAQTKYSSSGKVTLQPTTQSIIYMVEKDGGGSISGGDLASWQSSSQLEYGDYATDITAYIAPKVLGTFDYLEGDAKSIITKVGEGDNVHVGFIPDEGYLGIDYANSTDDLSQSCVAYRTIDLATQVANNTDEIEEIKSDLGVKDGEVTSEKIADGAVTLSKIGSDAKEYIDTKVAFLKLDDDGVLPQSNIPKFNDTSEIPNDSTTLAGMFGTGTYNLINGLVLDCFLFLGTTLCVAKFNGDGENNLTITDITPLENGAIVSMADGTQYKNYQILKNTTDGYLEKIWDIIYPMNCRFPFELAMPSGVSLIQSLSNMDLKLKMTSSSAQRFSLYIRNYYNSSISIDTSDYRPTNYAKKTFQLLLFDGNYGALTGFNTMAERASQGNDCISKYCIGGNSSTGLGTGIVLNVTEYSALNIGNTAEDPAVNYWFVATDDNVYDEATNKTVRYDYKFEFSSNGMGSFAVSPVVIEHQEAAEPTAMAMSVQAEPAVPNAPKGAVGIFSVDEHGNTINAMTGEVIG